MVKAKVIEKFNLKDFGSLNNLKRADNSKNKEGSLYLNDTFECDEKMADYLTGNNPLNKKVIEIIEVKQVDKEVKEIATGKITYTDEDVEPKVIIKKTKKNRK